MYNHQKLIDAARKESNLRTTAFLTKTESIGKFNVHSLTPRLLLVLMLADNALLTGGSMDITDLAVFLHIIMVDKMDNPNTLAAELILYPTEELELIIKEVNEYLEYAFHDMTGDETERPITNRDYCSITGIIDILASEYGWTDEYIMDLPYRRIAQLIRAIIRRKDPRAIFVNPLYDKAMGEVLEELNKQE